jgi:hypothetical protein
MWGRKLNYFLNLEWVYHNLVLRHDKTQQSPILDKNDEFARIKLNPIIVTSIEYHMKMGRMIYVLSLMSFQIIKIIFDDVLDIVKGI